MHASSASSSRWRKLLLSSSARRCRTAVDEVLAVVTRNLSCHRHRTATRIHRHGRRDVTLSGCIGRKELGVSEEVLVRCGPVWSEKAGDEHQSAGTIPITSGE